MKRNIILAVAVLLIFIAVYWSQSNPGVEEDLVIPGDISRWDPSVPSVGNLAPLFIAPTLKGEKVNLVAYRGKTVLLYFWNQDCADCIAQMEQLEDFGQQHQDAVVVLGVHHGRSAPEAQVVVDNLAITHTIFSDPDNHLYQLYAPESEPALYVIDPNGMIADRWNGLVEREPLETAIESARIDKNQ
ncbi:TlpA family protein disulfide reductase [Candidatus Peregrinibacteria bacterium]|nr:MAG: TlpA family protein disulfide reductase [Candidatus Peregrinibacteria bacterium]